MLIIDTQADDGESLVERLDTIQKAHRADCDKARCRTCDTIRDGLRVSLTGLRWMLDDEQRHLALEEQQRVRHEATVAGRG